MKFFSINLLVLSCGLALSAQTSPPAAVVFAPDASAMVAPKEPVATDGPVATNPPVAEVPRIEVHGDRLVGNFKSGVGSFIGHAGANHPDLELHCDVLHFELPRLTSSNYNRIRALTNVVIDFNRTNHLTGDEAVYTRTLSNGLPHVVLELIGNAYLTNPAGYITGASSIVYDPTTDDFHQIGGKIFLLSGTNTDFTVPFGGPLLTRTNPPVHRTNAPAFKPQIHP